MLLFPIEGRSTQGRRDSAAVSHQVWRPARPDGRVGVMDDRMLEDLREFQRQLQAGILLLEEMLDHELPDRWFRTARGGRRAPNGSLLSVREQLFACWVNIGHHLVRQYEVEAGSIPPLQTRGPDGRPQHWELGPDGGLDISATAVGNPLLREVPPGTVRTVPDVAARRYTLDEARRVLGICKSHTWTVETTETGAPVEVGCTSCSQRRPLA